MSTDTCSTVKRAPSLALTRMPETLQTQLATELSIDPKAFDWGNNNFHMATGNELVIYEMHIGTFNVKGEGQPGTFDSAIEKLPYLQQLGIKQ